MMGVASPNLGLGGHTYTEGPSEFWFTATEDIDPIVEVPVDRASKGV